jgi:hypothetical protein
LKVICGLCECRDLQNLDLAVETDPAHMHAEIRRLRNALVELYVIASHQTKFLVKRDTCIIKCIGKTPVRQAMLRRSIDKTDDDIYASAGTEGRIVWWVAASSAR